MNNKENNLKFFWDHHQVKIIAIIGLIILFFFVHGFYQHLPNTIFSKPKTITPYFTQSISPSDSSFFSNEKVGATPKWANFINNKQAIVKTTTITNHLLPRANLVKPIELKKPSTVSKAPHVNKNQAQQQQSIPLFLLQIMSSHTTTNLQRYIISHHLQQQAKIVKVSDHHQNWYLLIDGEYRTYLAAKKGLQHLPSEIKKMHPWVRPFMPMAR